jgi:hypothetical protein
LKSFKQSREQGKYQEIDVKTSFHHLLGLGESWEMVSLEVDRSVGTVEIHIRESPRLWDLGVKCPKSVEETKPYGHGAERCLCQLIVHHRLKAWIKWVRHKTIKDLCLKPVQRLSLTIKKHLDGILAHWQGKITNAFMEGLMSVFSATKRKARGYRAFTNLRTMLYFTASDLKIPCSPYFNSK